MKLKEIQAIYLLLANIAKDNIEFRLYVSDGEFTFSGDFLSLNKNTFTIKDESLNGFLDYEYSNTRAEDFTLLTNVVTRAFVSKFDRFSEFNSAKSFEYPNLLIDELMNLVTETDNSDLSGIDHFVINNVELLSGKHLKNFVLDKNAEYRVISLEVLKN